jgi:hypothetical protein
MRTSGCGEEPREEGGAGREAPVTFCSDRCGDKFAPPFRISSGTHNIFLFILFFMLCACLPFQLIDPKESKACIVNHHQWRIWGHGLQDIVALGSYTSSKPITVHRH